MKRNLRKVAALALAMTMCVPTYAFAEDTAFTTSFDVYSPVLTVSVPTALNIKVNPLADNTNGTGMQKFDVASESIDIINASVDKENKVGIPVVATIKAKITAQGNDVVSEYGTFTKDATSTKKKIFLRLTKAGTAPTVQVKASGGTAAWGANDQLDINQYELASDAAYSITDTGTPITKYGSLLSVDIAKPVDSNAGDYQTAADIAPKAASFAVLGVANTNADWKADDIAVAVTYNIKASEALSITTPTLSTAPTFTANSDATVSVSNIGEATVAGIALHKDGEKLYGDYIFPEASFKVDYSTAGTAAITIDKADAGLVYIAGDDYKTIPQDLVIVLSDGRCVVTTLTCN